MTQLGVETDHLFLSDDPHISRITAHDHEIHRKSTNSIRQSAGMIREPGLHSKTSIYWTPTAQHDGESMGNFRPPDFQIAPGVLDFDGRSA